MPAMPRGRIVGTARGGAGGDSAPATTRSRPAVANAAPKRHLTSFTPSAIGKTRPGFGRGRRPSFAFRFERMIPLVDSKLR